MHTNLDIDFLVKKVIVTLFLENMVSKHSRDHDGFNQKKTIHVLQNEMLFSIRPHRTSHKYWKNALYHSLKLLDQFP